MTDAFTSNQYVGAERFMSDDARGVLCVRAEHYEALRLRFEKACARVTELESASETPAVHPVTAECVEHDCQCQRGALKTISPRSEGEAP